MKFSRLQDILVTTIMSELSLGPKLYGIFPTGRLEELINVKNKIKNENSKKNAIILLRHHNCNQMKTKS